MNSTIEGFWEFIKKIFNHIISICFLLIYIIFIWVITKYGDPLQQTKFITILTAYLIGLFLIIKYFDPFKLDKHLVISDDDHTLKSAVKDYNLEIFFFAIIVGFIFLIITFFAYIPNLIPIGFGGNLLKLILLLLTLAGLVILSLYLFFYTPWPLTLVVNILNIGIIITTLALIFKYFKFISPFSKSDKTKASVWRLLKTIIYYIPCLFINLINCIKCQYNITTSTTWILLLIEIIIIGLRFLLPILYKQYNKLTMVSGNLVKKGPISLHNITDLGVLPNHILSLDSSELGKDAIFKYNYGLSFWIWINPQPPSTSEAYNKVASLLNYGDVLNINYHNNNIEILAATTKDNIKPQQQIMVYTFKNIQYQKWNNFILNYSGGTLDIFINNKLVSSTQNISPIMYYNKVTAGETDGIYGGIKNIMYYDHILSRKQIYAIYNQ